MTQHVGRIHCVQPNYGQGHPDSQRAFWVGGLKPGSPYTGRVNKVPGGKSLLANTFNEFWVMALNLQLAYLPSSWTYCWAVGDGHEHGEGWYIQNHRLGIQDGPYPKETELDPIRDRLAEDGEITHFAMLHHDVCPEDGWLEILMEELLAHDADLVSAVVPIKDNLGLSSTAIDDPRDHFNVERRVTMTEVHRLPPTFSSKDCGYPDRMLLVNTGCFVCRFDQNWRFPPFRFHIDDVIVHRDGSDGRGPGGYRAEVAPEDWNFSRHVQRAGGKVLATRKVLLTHAGGVAYTNQEPWGQFKVDEAFNHKHKGKGICEPPRKIVLEDVLTESLVVEEVDRVVQEVLS